jgi:hypothetical protein
VSVRVVVVVVVLMVDVVVVVVGAIPHTRSLVLEGATVWISMGQMHTVHATHGHVPSSDQVPP